MILTTDPKVIHVLQPIVFRFRVKQKKNLSQFFNFRRLPFWERECLFYGWNFGRFRAKLNGTV